jgi:hypothetical protein
VSGIFYDPANRRLRVVEDAPRPEWALVTHNLDAKPYHCRRILGEWLPLEELRAIDWSRFDRRVA